MAATVGGGTVGRALDRESGHSGCAQGTASASCLHLGESPPLSGLQSCLLENTELGFAIHKVPPPPILSRACSNLSGPSRPRAGPSLP